jgi:RES domain-containing protein
MMPSVAEIAQHRTIRLVPTSYYKPPVLRPLVDNDAELAILADLEGQTSARVSSPSLLSDFEGWGRTFIDAAFRYTRTGGSRFNGEQRGAWYAAFDDQTAIAEVAYHRTRELSYIGIFEDEAVYHALHASFIGRFHDIRDRPEFADCLHDDPSIGYRHGQELAAKLIESESRGLIYPSVRHDGGTCLVAFQPSAIQDVTPGARWRLVWNGRPEWTVIAE